MPGAAIAAPQIFISIRKSLKSKYIGGIIMVPSIYGENMFDEFFDNNGFFGSHSPLFGKNSKNLMKTDKDMI